MNGKVDTLEGLKENVIVGRLIPAGTGSTMNTVREIAAKRDALILRSARGKLRRRPRKPKQPNGHNYRQRSRKADKLIGNKSPNPSRARPQVGPAFVVEAGVRSGLLHCAKHGAARWKIRQR